MVKPILITGSEGLVGTGLKKVFPSHGFKAISFDLNLPPTDPGFGNILDVSRLRAAAANCSGIVHLAAVSRVVWGERDPDLCWRTNAVGSANVVQAAAASPNKPWVLMVSSREVYGEPKTMPVDEDHPIQPINIYGRAKAEAERATLAARDQGMRTAVVRLSNVYGSTSDHCDRVVPAFARGAATGSPLRVCGSDHTFDFTHVDDTVDGIMRILALLEAGERNLPPIHLLPGKPTTLGQLAALANAAGGNRSVIVEEASRNYDVAHFVGDPTRARTVLGWQAQISIEEGMRAMVEAFSRELASTPTPWVGTREVRQAQSA
jgi:nucleoside-diphosphate-sugar epimerase